MATLAAGASITLTMGEYDTVTVQALPGGEVTVEQPVGTKVAVFGGGSRSFGPYAYGAQVRLTAAGSTVSYDVGDGVEPIDPLTQDPATVLVDFGDSWAQAGESPSLGYETSFGWVRVLNTLLGKSIVPDGPFAKPAEAGMVLNAVQPFIV